MSGKFVLKKERGKYRYYLEDEKGNVVFNGPFVGEKDKALSFLNIIVSAESFANHLAPVQGTAGSPAEGKAGKKWVLRGELHSSREGEKGRWDDGTPLGFSAETFATEEEVGKAKAAIVKLMKGAEIVDET